MYFLLLTRRLSTNCGLSSVYPNGLDLMGVTFPCQNIHRSVGRAFRVQCERMPAPPPIVLPTAGCAPSSGEGVTADIKPIAPHGCYGVACITAMTVQSTAGVRRVDPCDPALVGDTL